MSALSNLVMSVIGRGQQPVGHGPMIAHPAVAHLSPHEAVNLHDLLSTHPAVQQLQAARSVPGFLPYYPSSVGQSGIETGIQGTQIHPHLLPFQAQRTIPLFQQAFYPSNIGQSGLQSGIQGGNFWGQ